MCSQCRVFEDRRKEPVQIHKLLSWQVGGRIVKANTPGANHVESPFWYLFGRDARGKQVRKATGTDDYNAAKRLVAAFETDLSRGVVTAENSRALKYEDIRDSYIAKKPSRANYHGLKSLDKFFKNVKVQNIDDKKIQEYVDARRKDKCADPTIRRNLVPLRAMLMLAWRSKKLQTQPYIEMPADSDPAGEYITPAQFAKIKNHLPQDLRAFFTFIYSNGCRLGAALKITWEMLNEDCTEISLPSSIIKTKRPLLIVLAGPILEPMAEDLRKFKKEHIKRHFRKPEGRIFPPAQHGDNRVRRQWAQAVAKVGLGTWDKKKKTRTGVRIHDCRCSGAINLLAAGVDESTVLKIGGWRSRSMLDRYNVQHSDVIKKAMERAGQFVQLEQQAAQK